MQLSGEDSVLIRRIGARLLIAYGIIGLIVGLVDVATGQLTALGVATTILEVGIGLGCGWLWWRGAGWRRVGAVLLLSTGAFATVMGLSEIVAGTGTLTYEMVGAARFGIPALACSWLLWRGYPARQLGAVVVASWALSFTLQAVVYADEPLTTIVLLARAGVPGLMCAWLLWRGCELRHLGAVLLVSWPVSYLIYALQGESTNNAIGELMIGVPTILVGCLLWRGSGREESAAASEGEQTTNIGRPAPRTPGGSHDAITDVNPDAGS